MCSSQDRKNAHSQSSGPWDQPSQPQQPVPQQAQQPEAGYHQQQQQIVAALMENQQERESFAQALSAEAQAGLLAHLQQTLVVSPENESCVSVSWMLY